MRLSRVLQKHEGHIRFTTDEWPSQFTVAQRSTSPIRSGFRIIRDRGISGVCPPSLDAALTILPMSVRLDGGLILANDLT
jgi:hypothetical protein